MTVAIANREMRVCARCVMDTTDPEITFDGDGICSWCRAEGPRLGSPPSREIGLECLETEFIRLKRRNRQRPYDCLIGLSGGADSSFLVHLAKIFGLRALLVHMDNGWDSELAVKNIESLVKKSGFDYENYVIDWEEFRDLQVAYFEASVIDIEVLTDHAIRGVVYHMARRHEIPWILRGSNPYTENVMPRSWTYNKNDLANILDIHRRYGRRPLTSYPTLGTYMYEYHRAVHGIREFMPFLLCFFPVNEVKETLRREFAWRDYGWKHYESVFTRFYQGYILPRKFGVDKRKAHLSALILSNQITRDEAQAILEDPPYNPVEMEADCEFVTKKLGVTKETFERWMKTPPVSHTAFATDHLLLRQRAFLALWRSGMFLVSSPRRSAGKILRTAARIVKGSPRS